MIGRKEGLKPTAEVRDGKLERFAIAGSDKNWHWAEASIDGPTVIVSSAEVASPVAVRYAYSMNPTGANLYNKEGIPASPFRTDNW
jgi:sialate O-acetylesterase